MAAEHCYIQALPDNPLVAFKPVEDLGKWKEWTGKQSSRPETRKGKMFAHSAS